MAIEKYKKLKHKEGLMLVWLNAELPEGVTLQDATYQQMEEAMANAERGCLADDMGIEVSQQHALDLIRGQIDPLTLIESDCVDSVDAKFLVSEYKKIYKEFKNNFQLYKQLFAGQIN